MKGLLVTFAAAVVGNIVAEKFLLKAGPDDPDGFIEVKDGLGMDDAARAATIALFAWGARKFLG